MAPNGRIDVIWLDTRDAPTGTFDSVLYYTYSEDEGETWMPQQAISEAFVKHTNWSSLKSSPYVVQADTELVDLFSSEEIITGITATNVGFYGPQGRVLRVGLQDSQLNTKMASFEYKGRRITNLEMETSGIYGMAKLLGHRAISLNAILANRANKTFSSTPHETVDRLIQYTLSSLVK